MLLAEAVAEKEYLKKSIKSLRDAIDHMMRSEDKPKNMLSKNLKSLDDLYKKYQQFEITIRRAEFQIKITLNDMEISIAEAKELKKAITSKLEDYEWLKATAYDSADIEHINDRSEEIRKDVKTLETAINQAMWSVEI